MARAGSRTLHSRADSSSGVVLKSRFFLLQKRKQSQVRSIDTDGPNFEPSTFHLWNRCMNCYESNGSEKSRQIEEERKAFIQ
jgi:hypothetical protein